MTLDYVDVTVDDETKTGIHFVPAAHFAFVKNGLQGNPWDRAVQFRDDIYDRDRLLARALLALAR